MALTTVQQSQLDLKVDQDVANHTQRGYTSFNTKVATSMIYQYTHLNKFHRPSLHQSKHIKEPVIA